jgi:hemerythrin-like domain-containing protein
LRRDHALIEKVLRALTVTAEILESGKPVPAPILTQSMEFTSNFMLVCHHAKEEETLFPALEQHGMPKEGGPIARMIFEHGIAKDLAAKMENSAAVYLQTGESGELVRDIRNYVEHVSAHLMKENLRLFMMADMILKGKSDELDSDLAATELSKLTAVGKTRRQYEELVNGIDAGLAR